MTRTSRSSSARWRAWPTGPAVREVAADASGWPSAGSGAGNDMTGRLLVGTSGFSYPDWIPRFYPPGTRTSSLLAAYAARLPAVELNATFRRRPTASAIRGWVAATPPEFRFVVKAQRSSTIRGLFGDAADSVAWL